MSAARRRTLRCRYSATPRSFRLPRLRREIVSLGGKATSIDIGVGGTQGYLGVKDITMMFSVSDLVGVNRFTERILANAAAAAYGMSLVAGTMEANVVPERYRDHRHVFHRPRIFVPRLDREEIVRVAHEISRRLRHTSARAVFMVPLRGVGRYSVLGGPLHDPESDRAFFDALRAGLPSSVEVVEVDAQAEAPAFVREAVRRRTRRPHQSFNGRVTKSEV